MAVGKLVIPTRLSTWTPQKGCCEFESRLPYQFKEGNMSLKDINAARGVIELNRGDSDPYDTFSAKCEKCGYEGQIDMWGCPKCKGMGNYFWMGNARSLVVEVNELIEKKLKEFEIKLTDEQEDKIHNTVWEVLEDVSNGYYKSHN